MPTPATPTDPETGLPTFAVLLEELERRCGGRVGVELLSLRGAGDCELPFALLEHDVGARVGAVLRESAEQHGGRAFCIGASIYALVADAADVIAPAAQLRLAELDSHLAGGVVHGRATMPDEALDGRHAVRIAYGRLRARSAWQRLSAARQARDVLLQLLSERQLDDAAARPAHVVAHVIAVGRRLGLALDELDELVRAAELQDVGLLVQPDAILLKRAPLSSHEWQIIRRHPVAGERILAAAPALAPVARLVRACYERFDGSGYPDGLRGAEIPLGARIIAVAVAFDAMTQGRPYQRRRSPSDALAELERCAGRQFDPTVVAAFRGELLADDPTLTEAFA